MRYLFFCLLLSACMPQSSEPAEAVARVASVAAPANDFHGSDVRGQNLGMDFVLPSTLNRDVALSESAGMVRVLVFGYTRCPDVCPTNLWTYAEALKQLGEGKKKVRVYFITLDPERDDAETLRSYTALFDSDFVGLIAPDETALNKVTEAWRVVSHRVPRADGDYLIDHSVGTYLIDASGQTAVYEPHGTSSADLAHDLSLLLSGDS